MSSGNSTPVKSPVNEPSRTSTPVSSSTQPSALSASSTSTTSSKPSTTTSVVAATTAAMPSNDASAAIASALQKKLPGLNSPPKPRLAPMQKPKGIDPIEMLREREYRYNQLLISCMFELPGTVVLKIAISFLDVTWKIRGKGRSLGELGKIRESQGTFSIVWRSTCFPN